MPNTSTRLTYSVDFGQTDSHTLSLTVSGAAATDTWVGGVNDGSGNFVWDINQTANWSTIASVGNQNMYFDLDTVLFGDSATNQTVTLNTTVTPSAVTINNSTGNDYNFIGSGQITGATGLTKSGTGVATIAINNNYTGITTINAGTLAIIANQSTTGATVINGGTLVFGNGGSSGNTQSSGITDNGALVFNRSDAPFTFGVPISGSGIVEQGVTGGSNTAILKLTGTSSYTGATNIKSGTVQAGANSNSLGNTNLANGPTGDVNISNGAALDLAGGAAANTVNFGSKNFKIVGTGTGTSGVIFNTGNSQFTAFENITLTGDATIGGVRFDIGRTGPTSTLDLAGHKLTVTMNNGQLFGVESFSTVTSGTIEVTQGALDIERTAVVHSDVPGSNIILDSGTNLQLFETVAGGVTRPIIANGNNIIGGGSNNTATLDAPISFTGGDLNIQQQASGVASGTGTGTLIVNGNITEFGGQFCINKSGPSTLVLAGSNTFSHALNINGGTVVLGNVNALGPTPSVNLNGNGLRLGGTSITIPQLSGGGVVSNGNSTPATLTLPITTGNTYGIDAALQDGAGGGALSLTVAGGGTVSLHATTNTFSGTTTISAGTLEVQNSLSNGPVVNNSALYFTNGGTLTYGGGISGGGIVRQTGGGTTILSGAHTFNSALQIDNGTVIVNGSLLASGTVNLNTDLGSPNLAGNGSVGNVRIGPNGGGSQVHISPGAAGNNSVGSLTMTSLAVAGGNPDFTLDLVTPANSDFINVTGNATFSVASTLSPSAWRRRERTPCSPPLAA